MDKYLEFKEGLDKAQTDTTPFIIPDDEIAVVGDANKTEINKHDFVIKFRIPEKMEDGTVKQVWHTKEYKDVYITPRMDGKVVKMITKLLPFYRNIHDDGEITDFTAEEAMKVTAEFEDDILDILYETVGSVLKINPALWDYMDRASVYSAVAKLLMQYPELVNEADTFFG